MKKIEIQINSNEDNNKIIYYIRNFLRDNFKEYNTAEIKIEDIE